MPVKIRLQRHGKKGYPFYHIVIADSRSPRDGRYIERLGSYNPNTNPATIELDVDGSVAWLEKGAQPTDTVRAMLSYTGALYKKHLKKGVSKGAFTEEQAEAKFNEWKAAKEAKIQGKVDGLAKKEAEEAKARLAQEVSVRNKRAEEIAAKNTPEVVEETAPEGEENTETSTEENKEASAE